MLTGSIMMQCISKLLEAGDEESLECLCKLLTTIGHELESRFEKEKDPVVSFGSIFSDYFYDLKEFFAYCHIFNLQKLDATIKSMKGIVKARTTSSRIRFMLQDVIDLKANNWKPRRGDQAPRTMDAIAKEAEQEHMAINLMQQQQPMMRGGKDDRGGGGKRGRGVSDDGWTTSGGGRSQANLPRAPLDSNKLKVKQQDDLSLGSRNQFMNWSKGSSSSSNVKGKNEPLPVPQTNNPYMLLSDNAK
jgi:translation initiation factor 4G